MVGDNPVQPAVAVGLLEALGYVARTADDGVAALEVLALDEFDLVLMDVQMPRMDGYAAATRAIREQGAGRVPGPGDRDDRGGGGGRATAASLPGWTTS